MSSNTLPFTTQDDLKQREKYSVAQQQKNASIRNCNSRRIRLWTILILVSLFTLALVTWYGSNHQIKSMSYFAGDEIHTAITLDNNEDKVKQQSTEENSLKQEILQHITNHELIVFSKTYCPFSMKAKRILNSYDLKETLTVIEVDLRDDDYEVKMVLKEISGRETFPNIFLKGESIGGSDTLEELHETGQLISILRDNHLLVAFSAPN